jgi:phosphatidylglycerol:prolipoprotein diacylglycerol transferase
MKRVLFSWRGIRIYSYPFMLYLGLTAGIVAGTYAAETRGLNPPRAYLAMLLLSASALAGARLLFVAANWRLYKREPGRIWRRSEGGYALYGGLLLAVLVSAPLLWALDIPLGKFWDAAAITILTGMIFVKIGCFLNGCCPGRETHGAFGFNLPDTQGIWKRRIPSQLIEAAFAAVLLAGAVALWQRLPRDGDVFLLATAVYAAGRWALESAREGVGGIGRITLSRAISVALILCAVAMMGWQFL